MKEDRFSPKRMIRMLGILISVAIYSVFLAIICKFTIDRVLVLVFINALYLPLLIAVIEMERIRAVSYTHLVTPLIVLYLSRNLLFIHCCLNSKRHKSFLRYVLHNPPADRQI